MPKPADPRVVKLVHPSAHKKPAADATPAPPPKKGKKQPGRPAGGAGVDWEGVERDYRAGVMTIRQIGEAHGISHTLVQRHAKRYAWARDLSERIAVKAEEKLAERTVSVEVANLPPGKHKDSLIVETRASQVAEIRHGQRQRFSQMAELSTEMFVELKASFANRVDLNTLGELLAQYTEGGAPTPLTKAFMDAVALPGQIKAFKDLTDIITKLTDMESKAFKLDKAPEEGNGGRASLPIRFVGTQYVERVEPGEDDE